MNLTSKIAAALAATLMIAGAAAAPAFSQTANNNARLSRAAVIDSVRAYPFNHRGVTTANPADSASMLAFAATLVGRQQADLDFRCRVIIAAPATYGADAANFCQSYRVAISLSGNAQDNPQE